jgi:hypothetical protein
MSLLCLRWPPLQARHFTGPSVRNNSHMRQWPSPRSSNCEAFVRNSFVIHLGTFGSACVNKANGNSISLGHVTSVDDIDGPTSFLTHEPIEVQNMVGLQHTVGQKHTGLLLRAKLQRLLVSWRQVVAKRSKLAKLTCVGLPVNKLVWCPRRI